MTSVMTADQVSEALKGRAVNFREALAELCIDLEDFDTSLLTVDQCHNCNTFVNKNTLKEGLCRVCDSYIN